MSFTDGPSRPAESREDGGTRWVEGPTAPDRTYSAMKPWLILLAVLVIAIGGFFGLDRVTQTRQLTTVTIESTDGITTIPSRNIVVRGDGPPIARAVNLPAGVVTVRDGDQTHTTYVEVNEYPQIKVGDRVEVCTIRHRLLRFTEVIYSGDC